MSAEAERWAFEQAPIPRTAAGKGNSTARHVLKSLAYHADPDGRSAYPSVELICLETELSANSVRDALKVLEQAGLIHKAGHSALGTVNWALNLGLRRPVSIKDEKRALEAERRRLDKLRQEKHRQKTQGDGPVTPVVGVTVTPAVGVTEPPRHTSSRVMSHQLPCDVTPPVEAEHPENTHLNIGARCPSPPATQEPPTSALGTDQQNSPSVGGPDQLGLAGDPPPAREAAPADALPLDVVWRRIAQLERDPDRYQRLRAKAWDSLGITEITDLDQPNEIARVVCRLLDEEVTSDA